MANSNPDDPNDPNSPSRATTGFLWILTVLLPLSTGCATVRVTDPYSTATEQFLLSTAAARAVDQLSFDALRDRKVYVDATYLSGDQAFLVGELRSKLLLGGVRLTAERKDSQIIVEIRSGGVGIDRYEFLLGLSSAVYPAITGLSTGNASAAAITASTPELAILKNTRQNGIASVAYVAYWSTPDHYGEVVAWSGPFIGRTLRDDWWIFGYGPRTVGNIAPTDKPK